MRVAFAYDRVNKFGGAERVLIALHEIWPSAPLFTSVYDPNGARWVRDLDIRTSFLQHVPWARTHHESFGWLMPLAFESLNLSKFDVVISVTSEAAKGIITNSRQLHVCYLLTPTRYLWSHAQEYRESLPRALQPFALVIQSKLRQWDFMAGQRPDCIVAISHYVKKRCQKYYRRGAEVIYPPTSLNVKRSDPGVRQGQTLSERTYYLVVSRLVPYKRIDIAIDACNKLHTPLIIVGAGSEESRLKALAGPTVRFSGHLTDEELVLAYRGAKALLMPQEEDFGLVGLEALGHDVPVISYRDSGAAEVVDDGKNGILFPEQTVESLLHAMTRFTEMEIEVSQTSRGKSAKLNAERFSAETFKEKFRSTIETLWKAHQ